MRTLLSRARWVVAISALLLLTPLSQAQLSWNITYADDGTGEGFDINTGIGATRQATVNSALA